jgi:hypothetical protein
MATNILEGGRPSDWLKREADSLYSREQVVIVSGAGALKSGTVLGKITASGKYKATTVAAADGSEDAAGILLEAVDATAADVEAVIIARDAIVSNQGLSYGADVNTAPERAAVHAALAALVPPILVREGA